MGIAPADAVIGFNDREAGTAAMVAVDWVMPDQFTNGAFTNFLNLPTAKLVKGKKYAIYTWQATRTPTRPGHHHPGHHRLERAHPAGRSPRP